MASAAPIRTQRTGFQKIAQVLSDSLLREIAPPRGRRRTSGRGPAPQAGPLFRQPAGRGQTGGRRREVALARRHAPGACRWHGRQHDGRRSAFERQVQKRILTPDEAALASRFAIAPAARSARHPGVAAFRPWPAMPSAVGGLTMQQLADQILAQARAGLSTATDLEAKPSAGSSDDRHESGRCRPQRHVDESRRSSRRVAAALRLAVVPAGFPGRPDRRRASDHRTRIQNAAREAVAEIALLRRPA